MTEPGGHANHSSLHPQAQSSQTETVLEGASSSSQPATSGVVHLRLQPPRDEPRVKWTSDTVDNEFMGKKKSKCCCIYEKPKLFGESSSSEEDDHGEGCTPNCRGHKKKCYQHKKPHHSHDHSHDHHDHDGGHDNLGSFPPGGATPT